LLTYYYGVHALALVHAFAGTHAVAGISDVVDSTVAGDTCIMMSLLLLLVLPSPMLENPGNVKKKLCGWQEKCSCIDSRLIHPL
jgi:hypothetical protein